MSEDFTRTLRAMQAAGEDAPAVTEKLLGLLYPELHRLAESLMRRERSGHTLQPTALVHEAYLKLVDDTRVEWQDRAHFLGIAARAMRQILVDHARKHQAAKRGGGMQRVTLDESFGEAAGREFEVLALNEALEKFARVDERAARVVELKVFAGMKIAEIAHVLDVSKRTVDGDWAMARMWLGRELGEN
ncbi:MAG: sigma-70 family RNA polymerase sigma factor [bacterium]|nr:sigma-70 family RNA polymerase sigma factor [Gemmatimonadota bacterium]